MKPWPSGFVALLLLLSVASAGDDPPQTISLSLTVPLGAPLRLYLTKKVPKRLGAPVQAKLLEPLFVFDREVVPAGADVSGRVSRLESLTKWQRARSILGGDFTPLHRAQIQFTSLTMPDGNQVAMQTAETTGLKSIYLPPPKKKKQKTQSDHGGVLGTGKQTVQDQINAQINTRTKGIAEIVRGPNKKERLVDFAMAKLPYHPQWVRRGTRFDAELKDPLQFGSQSVAKNAFVLLGSQPAADSVAMARLITPLDSALTKKGQTVEALVVAPLYSPEHNLVLPEGTRLVGAVVLARRARWFHRGGQLRFKFQRIDLPEQAARLKSAVPEAAPLRTQAMLEAAESGGPTSIKVDTEGGVHTTEPKSRLLAPLISVMIANRSMDNDTGRVGGGDTNISGRTLGGGSGLGLLGAAAAQSSRYVGTALGFYGMAWSVYTNVIARGGEVRFEKNAAIEIKFGTRTVPAGSKFVAESVGPQALGRISMASSLHR